ncbi:hypothetical protein ACFQDD_00435 [Halorubrum pallidum]|uniref:Uncharacterized protein n=1 Tax=Halorubrum pallidum TaxID=1526114 RepID=A0ABD5SYH9_9EURY
MARSHTSTPVSELEPKAHVDDRELSPWERHGTRGAGARLGEDRAGELRRKGAFYEGNHVEVVAAVTTGVSSDGTIEGEAEIRPTDYSETVTVRYGDLELPSDAAMRSLNREDTTRVPAYYEAEIDARERVAEDCPVDVYCSSANRFWGWKYKLVSYYNAAERISDSGGEIIVDSGVNRWGSPDDVLAAAAKVDADYVVATDVTGMEVPAKDYHNPAMPGVDAGESSKFTDRRGDAGGVFNAALEGIRRFMERARELGIEDRVILPIQPPYIDFLDACAERGWLDEVSYVAVGGLLTIDDVADRIDALREVRSYLGDDFRIHALAPGRDAEMIDALRENPSLVDSLDNSTPEQAPANDKLPGASGTQTRHQFPRGDDTSVLRGVAAAMIALETAQMLSGKCDPVETWPDRYDEPVRPSDDSQAQIEDWAAD